jgi:hypothetical protein
MRDAVGGYAPARTLQPRPSKGGDSRRDGVFGRRSLVLSLKPPLQLKFRSSTRANKVTRPHSLHERLLIEHLMCPWSLQDHLLPSHVQILNVPTFFGRLSP